MPKDPVKKKQMFSFIEQWKKTDQTQMEFCHENGIKYSTFLYWMKVYKRRSQKQDYRFLPVEIVSSESNRQQEEEPKKPKAELEFDSGIILRIY